MDTLVTKRKITSLEKYVGITVVLILLLIIFTAAYLAEAEGYKQSGKLEKTPQTYYMRGDLTARTEDKPYGGTAIIGDYLVTVDTKTVKIIATLDNYSHQKFFEGWLLDSNSAKMLKIGSFDNGKLRTTLAMDTIPYDAIIITEKIRSNNNSVDAPIGGALLEKSPEYKSCKCF